MTSIQQLFIKFIRDRDRMRVFKELGMLYPLVMEDPILESCRFCNVNREHDRVTVWIKKHLRDPFAGRGKNFMVVNLLVARIFNEPDTLQWLIPMPLDNIQRAKNDLAKLRADGKKLFRGAYMMPAHGNNGKGQTTEDYWMRAVEEAAKMDFSQDEWLCDIAQKLQSICGLGDFLANQVCADLRYVPDLEFSWNDWDTFVRCGPGTRRGINRYDGLPTDPTSGQQHYINRVLEIREDIKEEVPIEFNDWFRDPNNLANCFCEFDKYARAREQLASGKSTTTLRKYKEYGNQ